MAAHFKRTVLTIAVLLTFFILPWASELKAAPSDAGPGFRPAATEKAAIPAAAPTKYTGERISLDFQNEDIHNIIRILGDVAGKKIAVSDSVSGKVTLKLTDVPWDQALNIILSSKNLGLDDSDNVLTVYDLSMLQTIQAERARVQAERSAPKVIGPLAKHVFSPKYSPVSKVSAELEKLKSGRGKLTVIGKDIYIEDEPGAIATMRQVFMRVDRAGSQILIETRIIKTSAAFAWQLGVQGPEELTSEANNAPSAGDPPPKSSVEWSQEDVKEAKLKVVILNKAETKLLNDNVNAEEGSEEIIILSAPRIMAANDQLVSIKQGQSIGGNLKSSARKYARRLKFPLIELQVKPHINEYSQVVYLDMNLTNEAASTDTEAGLNINNAAAKLGVKDGETLAISGIFNPKFKEASSADRVLPLADWLINDPSSNDDPKSELIILITPRIIHTNI